MDILWPDMHNTLTRCLGLAFRKLGHNLLLPDNTLQSSISYGRKWTPEEVESEIKLPNVRTISREELFTSQPDVLFISCFEVERDVLTLWSQLDQSKTKLAYYNGNDNTGYQWDYVKNYLTADGSTKLIAREFTDHVVSYWPWVDYDMFSFTGPSFNPVLRTYINNYENLFPNSYSIMETYRNHIKNIDIEVVDGKPKKDTLDLMRSSMGTMHIKELEGYGYAVLESMATGRPVFIYRPFAVGKTLMHFCSEGETCFMFSTLLEYEEKLSQYVRNKDHCAEVQKTCSEQVRKLVDNNKQTDNLKIFLDKLK